MAEVSQTKIDQLFAHMRAATSLNSKDRYISGLTDATYILGVKPTPEIKIAEITTFGAKVKASAPKAGLGHGLRTWIRTTSHYSIGRDDTANWLSEDGMRARWSQLDNIQVVHGQE